STGMASSEFVDPIVGPRIRTTARSGHCRRRDATTPGDGGLMEVTQRRPERTCPAHAAETELVPLTFLP
ncbi:MAG: hypothetical protein QG597_4282, partial [Actinomycetota bacterium]|nr:hypothetical protein [Actinomycetota bacterium]